MSSSLEERAAPGLGTDHRTGAGGPTPARILAQLSENPGPPPVGFTAMVGEDITISLINSGDCIGIDGRWCPVVGCTSVNGWVSVETKHGYPVVTAYGDALVYLAREIDTAGVSDAGE